MCERAVCQLVGQLHSERTGHSVRSGSYLLATRFPASKHNRCSITVILKPETQFSHLKIEVKNLNLAEVVRRDNICKAPPWCLAFSYK